MNVDSEMPLRDDWTTLFSNNPKLELTFGTSWIWEHKSRDFAVMILIIKIVPLKIFCFFGQCVISSRPYYLTVLFRIRSSVDS